MKDILDTINLLSGSTGARQRLPRLFWHLAVGILALSLPFSLKAAETKGDLPNFHVVHDYLLRGGEPSHAGVKELHALGVKTIIDLRAPSERRFNEKKEAEELGMHYFDLPMTSAAPTTKQVTEFVQAVSQAEEHGKKADPDRTKTEEATLGKYSGAVYVHCAHGSDRTGCMVGIWRVSHDHWNYQKAYDEMRQYYFGPKYTDLANAVRTRAAN
jgi:protein tyrosine/serine phosphatase